MRRPFNPTLCLVIGPGDTGGRDPVWVADQALTGGVTMLQLRWKDAPDDEYASMARKLGAIAHRYGAAFIVNDRPAVAATVRADGVHVGQSDMSPAAARALLGPAAIIGLSIENPGQLAACDFSVVDYLGAGPIFPTLTKADAAPALGTAGLAEIRSLSRLPLIAIGGVGPKNASLLRQAGADGLAVVSTICAAENPQAAARAIREAFVSGSIVGG